MNLAERIAALAAEYGSSLIEDAERIRAMIAALDDRAGADAARATLRAEAHRIAGSAGSFGFEALAGAARRLDAALGREDEPAATRAAVDGFAARLAAAVRTAGG